LPYLQVDTISAPLVVVGRCRRITIIFMMIARDIGLMTHELLCIYLKERSTHWTSGLATGLEPPIEANGVELVFAGLTIRSGKRLVIGL